MAYDPEEEARLIRETTDKARAHLASLSTATAWAKSLRTMATEVMRFGDHYQLMVQELKGGPEDARQVTTNLAGSDRMLSEWTIYAREHTQAVRRIAPHFLADAPHFAALHPDGITLSMHFDGDRSGSGLETEILGVAAKIEAAGLVPGVHDARHAGPALDGSCALTAHSKRKKRRRRRQRTKPKEPRPVDMQTWLRYQALRSHQEVADELGISKSTSCDRCNRVEAYRKATGSSRSSIRPPVSLDARGTDAGARPLE